MEFENWLRRREYTPRTVRDICCRLRRVRQTLGLSEIGRDTEGQITRENFPGCRSALGVVPAAPVGAALERIPGGIPRCRLILSICLPGWGD